MKENLSLDACGEEMFNSKKNDHIEINVDALVARATKFITPVWPLETFIACNPLQGFEDEHFDEAMQKSFQMYRVKPAHAKLSDVNREMIKWSGAFLDIGQGSIEMPNRAKGFYRNFCELALYDFQLHRGQNVIKDFLVSMPEKPQEAVSLCLKKLNISEVDYDEFMVQNFAYLPGWAGYVKWLSMWSNSSHLKNKLPINLVQYIAVRLILTVILWPDIPVEKKKIIKHQRCLLEIEAIKKREQEYLRTFIPQLRSNVKKLSSCKTTPDVQMVFCIDVRSEPFRKKIEALGSYETLGFAGFFGLPVRIHDEKKQHTKDCCPVLLKPRFDILTTVDASQAEKKLLDKRQDLLDSFKAAYHQLKYNYTTPFTLADAMGPWCGLGMILKNFTPHFFHQLLKNLKHQILPNLSKSLQIDSCRMHTGIPAKEQIAYADVVLRLMGLTEHFAKLIVFCGHQSTTTNNPYASALDCGACGGNHGGDNAQILAKILNQAFVRDGLKERGIHIPQETLFLSAVHDTTTDDCVLHQQQIQNHQALLNQLIENLKIAKEKNGLYRCQFFDEGPVSGKSLNWSEVRPEWGLARNAAFIVGPRDLTKDMNLDGRCFLHSYRWEIDEDGKLLETILTAPMVVAQWINNQYLFSTIDNVNYGSGSKITHNVVGKLGIMQGNASDLMHGLSLQSVNLNDQEAFHQPQRLLTVVLAPREKVEALIAKHEILQKLFFNQWVQLLVLEPSTLEFHYLFAKQQWKTL
jgi:uncharacterized protein